MAEYTSEQLSPGAGPLDHETRIAVLEGTVPAEDHSTAAADHVLAASDHVTAAADHTTAGTDHTTAGTDSGTAAQDHETAAADHAAIASQDICFAFVGKPGDGAVMDLFVATRALAVDVALAGGQAKVATNPTASTVLTLKKGASAVGTITFATNGTPTLASAAGFALAAGDVLTLNNQATADASAATFAITLKALRS